MEMIDMQVADMMVDMEVDKVGETVVKIQNEDDFTGVAE